MSLFFFRDDKWDVKTSAEQLRSSKSDLCAMRSKVVAVGCVRR